MADRFGKHGTSGDRQNVLLLTLILGTVCLPMWGKIPLRQAIGRAESLDPGLAQQVFAEERARIDREWAERQRQFKIELNGLYRFSSDSLELKVSDLKIDWSASPNPPDSHTILIPGQHHLFDLGFILRQPIYWGGVISAAIEGTKQGVAAARSATLARKLELAATIKRSYFAFQLLLCKKRSLELSLQALREHEKQAGSLFRNEFLKKTDWLETRARMEEFTLGLAEIELAMAREKMGFERLCGCDLEQIEDGYHEAIEDFDRSFDFFLRHHPGLRVLSAQMTMAQLERKRASGEGLPHLGGFAELHGGNPRNVVYDQWKVYVLAGLSFSIPVLNRSDIQRAMALSDLAGRELENRREAAIAEGRIALQELYTTLGSLQSRIPTLEKLANLRGEEAGLKGKLLGAGQIAHAEYLDSLAARDRTLVLRQELDLQLEATRVAINAAIGRLEEEE